MKRIVLEEESRSLEYINNDINRRKYVKKVDEILISQDFENRIKKLDGLKKYLAEYNPTQENADGGMIAYQ